MTARARYWAASTLFACAWRCAALAAWFGEQARRMARLEVRAPAIEAASGPVADAGTPTDFDCAVAIAVLNARISMGKARVQ